jgi:putative DNA methylase
MTPYPKRLIEVDLPIARISAHARREKSIRHGHISTLHIWWARRPLAACRAVILASLWPDPVDLLHGDWREHADPATVKPARFIDAAKAALRAFADKGLILERDGKIDAHTAKALASIAKNPALLDGKQGPTLIRAALLHFIADFANWDNSTDPLFLSFARDLTQAAHECLGGEPGTRPLVIDPFAGGGSIPLEALRVGADAFASDLNPIPVLLNKVVLEYIPKHGQRLADEVRAWGQWIKDEAEKELAAYYPKDAADKKAGTPEATPIAYLWARTVLSEAPGEGTIPVEVPLMRSLWLAKKTGRKRALRWVRDDKGRVKTQTVEVIYRIDGQPTPTRIKRPLLEIFEPKKDTEVEGGTVARGNATCPVTGYTTKVDRVRAQLKWRRGGAADARLFCVVTTRNTEQGRFYRLPTKADQEAFDAAAVELAKRMESEGNAHGQRSQILTRTSGGTVQSGTARLGAVSMVPDEPTPLGGGKGAGRAFSQRNYGMDYFADLFTPRQLLALTTLARLVREAGERMRRGERADTAKSGAVRANEVAQFEDTARAARHPPATTADLADAVQACLAMALSKNADLGNSLTRWKPDAECPVNLFGRQAIPIVWEFGEAVLTSESSGSFASMLERTTQGLECVGDIMSTGHVEPASATAHPLPDDAASAYVTDPPYYDAVPYSDLSDFFYIWLKRTLPPALLPAFAGTLTPKDEECIVDDAKGKDHASFEAMMQRAMAEGRRVTAPTGIGVVVFAHKSTAGWEAQLKGMIAAGWTVTGSWPIDTEMGSRLRAMDSAALASSVHLVVRPRETDEVGEWREVLAELPKRIAAWMPRLAAEGVVGADAIFACLGPALEVFSRYARVEKNDGTVMGLKDYLPEVWTGVSKEALSMIMQDADASGLEPDARLTAMWLWTLGGGKSQASGDAAEGDDDDDAGGEDDAPVKKPKVSGFVLEYDAARMIGQGLGVVLEKSESIVEIKGEIARLRAVSERTKHLFGTETQDAGLASSNVAAKKARAKAMKQAAPLFQSEEEIKEEVIKAEVESAGKLAAERAGATVLDRVHQSMLLFAAGRGEALKRFLVEDGVGKDGRFWKLAQSLSALYPTGTDEKRWVDGVLARKKGLGF